MASESSARSGDDADATGLPPRPSPPINVSAGSARETGGRADVDRSTAAPPVQEAPRHGMVAATVRVLDDDDPPLPLLHVVDHEKQTDGAEGPQLHDGPPGPSLFPSEFDDSLSKRVENEVKGPQLHDGPPGPSSFPSEFDDSLARKLGNDSEQNSPDNARDDASTVHSTAGPNAAYTAAPVGPSMVEGVEEVNVSSRGATSPARSQTEASAATATVGLTSSSSGRSTIVVEAYRVEEAEETPGMGPVYEAELAVLPFYQRKGFLSAMIAVTLLAVGVAVVAVMLLSNNMDGNTGGVTTSSGDSLFPVPGSGGAAPQTSPPSNETVIGQTAPLLTTSVPSNDPTKTPTRDPTKTPTSSPTRNVSQREEPRQAKFANLTS